MGAEVAGAQEGRGGARPRGIMTLDIIENGSMSSVDGENNIHGLRDRRTVAVLRRSQRKRSGGGERKALSDSALKVGLTVQHARCPSCFS